MKKTNIIQESFNLLQTPVFFVDARQTQIEMNQTAIKDFGALGNHSSFQKEQLFDFLSEKTVKKIFYDHGKVFRSRKLLTIERKIKILKTNEVKYFNSVIAPLEIMTGEVVGTTETAIDITLEKKRREELRKETVLNHLEMIANVIPVNVYWLDLNNIILGVNEYTLKAVGVSSSKGLIGKTVYDLYPEEMAERISKHHFDALKKNKTLRHEETIKDVTTGEVKYFSTVKTPLYDDEKKIIGTIGVSIDITATKKTERLKVENAENKIKLQEQEKFSKTIHQMAHDIRSPLASLLMIIKGCQDIPEVERVALREAAISIGDIANHLLSKYEVKEIEPTFSTPEPVFVSAVLLQILTDKKFQYGERPIKFDYDFYKDSEFSFISMDLSTFKRMISNLINNAVDSFERKEGKVILKLAATPKNTQIMVCDDGKGMSKELVDKIMDGISFTDGKQQGHGLGLEQVRDALEYYQGSLFIDSSLEVGTKIIMEFPRVEAPSWVAESITLSPQDVVVILDDDKSIHGAWKTHFKKLIKQSPNLQIHHFEKGEEAIRFIQTFKEEDLKRIFLLTDFELLQQELNGLHVVERTQVKRAILVTSHYANPIVLERAQALKIKILPKQLASDIPIVMEPLTAKAASEKKSVDLILVDDDLTFSKTVMKYIFSQQTVEYFQTPEAFLEKVMNYPKETPIYLDNQFKSARFRGIDIAKDLHEKGFKHLYLLSGATFKPGELPDYLTLISKEDITKMRNP